MNTWKVTLKTGPNKWSTVTVDCQTHFEAITVAKRLLGNFAVTNIATAMTTTSTFIDYAADSFGSGVFSIDTSGSTAMLTLALNHPEFAVTYEFSRSVARELGTNLLQWIGSPLCSTLEPVQFSQSGAGATSKPLRVEVIDGTVMFLLSDGNFQATDAEVVDLAQRLIVWAGVDTRAVIHS